MQTEFDFIKIPYTTSPGMTRNFGDVFIRNPNQTIVRHKKQELENLGYKCLMLMIYVSPITALERNATRGRSLLPSIVLRTWGDINRNISIYEQTFGPNLTIINNDPKESNKEFRFTCRLRKFGFSNS